MYRIEIRNRETNQSEILLIEASSMFDAYQKAKAESNMKKDPDNWYIRSGVDLEERENSD